MLENKPGLTSSADLAREEERISSLQLHISDLNKIYFTI